MAKTSFIFLLLLVASFFEAATANNCSWLHFYCSNSNQCKLSRLRCDGNNDCSHGEDEQGCPAACSDGKYQFRCNNRHCISRRYVCDGDNDCGDNSDESSYLCGVRRSGTALQCYSCSSSSCNCVKVTCPFDHGSGFCYRKTYDRIIGGSKKRVTVSGCTSTCTSSDKTAACRYESNCQMKCCTSSLCNRGFVPGVSAHHHLSCYTCVSSLSYKDCERSATLKRCSSGTTSCYKMFYRLKKSSPAGESSYFMRGCIHRSYLDSCSKMRSDYCGSMYVKKCNLYCCTGSGSCKLQTAAPAPAAGSIQRFSVVVLVTCAVAFLVLGYPAVNPSYSWILG